MTDPLATVDQLEQIATALARIGIAGGHGGAYVQGAIDRAPGSLTAAEAGAIIDILNRGEVTE
jgi:hypothetical protein